MYLWMHVIYDVYLMQSQHIIASHDWERERASWSECVQKLEWELGTFCMDQDDKAPGPGGRDVWVGSTFTSDGDYSRCSY